MGRNNSNPSTGSSGHTGVTRPGQTRKKPKDLSTREREDRGREEGGGVYVVCICDREYCDRGVGIIVNTTRLSVSETL